MLGMTCAADEITRGLGSLGCTVHEAGEALSVEPPTWRHDLLLEVDLIDAAHDKMRLNALKYPVERARGSSRKYDRL